MGGGLQLKPLLLQPLFWVGLLIRLLLVFTVVPASVSEWYAPFLDLSVHSFVLDPWSAWLAQGGTPVAFPYGYVMWLLFLPAVGLCQVLHFSIQYGYDVTLLLADFCLFILLCRMSPQQKKLVLWFYWLSPIVIIASYFLGFNDLIPVLLLSLALSSIKHYRLVMAGVWCMAAISAKLSMVLALPFFLIYVIHNRALKSQAMKLLKGFALGTILFLLPFFIFSPAGVSMIFNNPEMKKIYQFSLTLGNEIFIYLVPFTYLLMLYLVWRVKRLNFDLFYAMLHIAFLVVVLLTPASPGWFIWAIPLLVSYQTRSDRLGIFLVALFSSFYVFSSLLLLPEKQDLFSSLRTLSFHFFSFDAENHVLSLLHTTMTAIGIILGVRIWRDTIQRNDYFRLSRKPFVLGIAGDSGAGKDTLSEAMKGLFGGHSVTQLSGDDYHLWDRQKPMWQVMTHLNPMANDLDRFANDLVALIDGKSIQGRHYNHQTGQMSPIMKIKSNDIIIASGLHTLYLPLLRECYNVSVYLDIDEELRRYFKIQRDVHERGHALEKVLSSFARRDSDSERFIRPQAAYADLILSLQPIHPRLLHTVQNPESLRFKLVACARHGLNEFSLQRALVGICGLHVDRVVKPDGSGVALTLEGETSAEDIQLAAHMVCPRILEFLDIQPRWQNGVVGLMQLITLSHINQSLTRRFIW